MMVEFLYFYAISVCFLSILLICWTCYRIAELKTYQQEPTEIVERVPAIGFAIPTREEYQQEE